MTKRDKALLGAAGVHYVCAELCRRGHIALPTTRSTAGIDVLASSADGARQAAIQVKASSSGRIWRLSENAETMSQPGLFYVFVGLPDGGPPSFHVVPSAVVAERLSSDHARWLATPGKHGQAHVDNPIRTFSDPKRDYLDQWDLLGLEEVLA